MLADACRARWVSILASALLTTAGGAHAAASRDSVLQMAKPGDPGTPLVIRGRVITGMQTGLPGLVVRVYHADPKGTYGRYDGTLTTGPGGGYEVRTVRPGSYGYAAHVHFVVMRGGKSQYTLEFTDDPKRANGRTPKSEIPVLPDSLLKGIHPPGLRIANVRPVVVGADGVHRVERDLYVR
jgi:hypothetical protein